MTGATEAGTGGVKGVAVVGSGVGVGAVVRVIGVVGVGAISAAVVEGFFRASVAAVTGNVGRGAGDDVPAPTLVVAAGVEEALSAGGCVEALDAAAAVSLPEKA
ncbi:hypothetical protein GTO89_11195 [Heliobacterium gestii]|uniref:Uncharacterized protein n=1 Tax=Heliomicrobium gestii TaxID=2699 RepID=A0A845LA47_HELGE|nr:hypothetical protein [Heliomicrobium gestii]MBM7867340.1 hypothetical protein [Heliomicrobium gestii]MZP43607.1 hypothetical protein [Heliomicrobium gestii]